MDLISPDTLRVKLLSYIKGCKNKNKYPSVFRAQVTIDKEIKEGRATELRAYFCQFCQFYHLTKQKLDKAA